MRDNTCCICHSHTLTIHCHVCGAWDFGKEIGVRNQVGIPMGRGTREVVKIRVAPTKSYVRNLGARLVGATR